MRRSQLRLRLSGLYERFRGSLFYVPAAYVVVATLLAWTTNRLDETLRAELPDIPVLLPTTVESARSLLSTIAAATITVAGVVFSLTVVAAQLTSSQYSPRVLRGLLRDRFSQNVIGVVVATFTYCLLILAVTRTTGASGEQPVLQSISVTVAVGLSVVAILGIIAFLDHSARSMRVGEVVRRVAGETHQVILAQTTAPGEQEGDSDPSERDPDVPDRDPDVVVSAPREGWVQQIDLDVVLGAIPGAALITLETRPGRYVIEGQPVATLWFGDERPDGVAEDVRRAFAIGDERTMRQDVMFGVRQLVDIALRAMSTGINDPTTTIETLYRLGNITRQLALRELPPQVVVGEDGRRIVRRDALGRDEIIRYAFRQIRVAAIDQPGVIKVLVDVLGEVARELRRHGRQDLVPDLEEEARLALEALESHGHLQADVAPVRASAHRHGLIGGTVT